MKRLSKEQILMLHSQLIEQTGGTPGVRDFNLLESAIESVVFCFQYSFYRNGNIFRKGNLVL